MEKFNKLGYTKIEIMIVIVILGLFTFIALNKVSYAFKINNNDAVKEVIKLIELQAKEYAYDNLEIFKESNQTYISVSDLITSKYLIANENGLITNPSDINKNFNGNKIKLEYKNNKVYATLIN